MSERVAFEYLVEARTRTPLRALRIRRGGTTYRLWLKLEQENPTGSVKYRTALGLLAGLDEQRPLVPGTRVVESTSGNLGLALAHLLAELDCRFIAVVDPKVSQPVLETMRAKGTTIVPVTERDRHGGYLITRLDKVAQLCAEDPGLRWADQYGSPAGPRAHRHATAAELIEQTGGAIDAVLIAVSTGGTLAGVSEGLRATLPDVQVIAVDAHGSLVTGGRAYPHLLTGIGATRRSQFLRAHHYQRTLRAADVEAFAYCRMLSEDTGLAIGGSGGAVLAAYAGALSGDLERAGCPVAVVADAATNYLTTCYSDQWLAERGVADRVHGEIAKARAGGLSFDLEGDVS